MNSDYTFNGQREGEEVIDVVPIHPYKLYSPGFRIVLLIALAVAIILFLPKLYIISIVLLIFATIYFLNAFYSYRETTFLITNQRLFSIEQQGFFKRKIAEVGLNNIIDLASETRGFARVMLKYGDLIIRTAGAKEGGDIVLKDIPEPYHYQQKIAKIINDNKSKS